MLNIPVLTDTQIQQFADDGYLVLRRGFSPGEMARIDAWTDEILTLPEVSGRHWVFHEQSRKNAEQRLVSRIERISPFHDGFKALAEALRAPVSQLLGENAALFKEKINFKMPGGDGFKPHQDSQAGWDAYTDFFISALVSIDAATEENGCLKLVRGHHKNGMFRSWEPMTDADMAGMDFQAVPTNPGDVVFFDSFAPHASEANMSERIRRIYYATYNRASAGHFMDRYYADKHKNYPPDIDRDPAKQYVFRV
ncbi:MAG: phytanoyl-CoA dioxygenase [Rhodospirillales bacterium CG15_BIG_FIL_POST_REV_8_21_14_020_66_15]|nr:MAG: phytanoyl-CoA dioxygenase [Rhodospirillales bacterium CG15_BIG_FIL_POST_REV_8_21_14_020_66_15]